MTVVKRSVITLYSGALDIYSHLVRIVLAEKGVGVEIVHIDEDHPSPEWESVNPYRTLPTLIDRDLVLYSSQVILEYLDERFPHPPLLPVYPVFRAKSRLMIARIQKDWYSLFEMIQNGTPESSEQARSELKTALMSMVPVFANSPYFLSEDFTLVDCVMMPLLWRLPYLNVHLPYSGKAKPIAEYTQRVFERVAFQSSLSEAERELRE